MLLLFEAKLWEESAWCGSTPPFGNQNVGQAFIGDLVVSSTHLLVGCLLMSLPIEQLMMYESWWHVELQKKRRAHQLVQIWF